MQTALQELETTYFTLQAQIGLLSVACQTQPQKDALSTQYVQARQNYWSCVNKAFHDDDPQVVTLTNQIDAANQKLTADVKQLTDIGKTITDITNVVAIGTQLAAKVITV